MPLPTRITLPPSSRPVGGLLSAARSLDGEWWRGVKFSSGQCLLPQVVGSCTDGGTTKTMQSLSDEASFEAFAVIQALECSTMGRSDLAAYTGSSLDATREFGVASEFLTGAASGNPSLADADIRGSADGATAALACLDQLAGRELGGRLAFIHAPYALGTHLLAAGAIEREGRTWRTAGGNVVVISSGYDGRAPGADPVGAGDSLYLYATGEVYAATGQRDAFESVERGQNTLQAIAEDAAIAVFDPCFNVAVDSGVDFCASVS